MGFIKIRKRMEWFSFFNGFALCASILLRNLVPLVFVTLNKMTFNYNKSKYLNISLIKHLAEVWKCEVRMEVGVTAKVSLVLIVLIFC